MPNLRSGASFSTYFAKVVREKFETPFLEALDRDEKILQIIKRKSHGGHRIQKKVRVSGNSSSVFYNETTTYGAAGNQTFENIELPIKQLATYVQFSGLAAKTAAGGDGSWVNVKLDEVQNAMKDHRSKIHKSIIANTVADADTIECLGSIINDTGTYAGLDRALGGNAWFRSVVLANASVNRALTLTLMNNMWTQLHDPARQGNPSHILCLPGLVDTYLDLAESRKQYTIMVPQGGPAAKMDVANGEGSFKGVPLVPIYGIGANRMYFIDNSTFDLLTPMAFEVKDISATVNADAEKYAIMTYLQLFCDAPFKNGVIKDLTTLY